MGCKGYFTHRAEEWKNRLKVVNRVRELRKKNNITQIQMAKDLKITRQTIHAIESGKYNPSLTLALQIVRYFDVPIDEVFYLEGE